jgi:acetyltransferase-like isoleucine patch superfamily enzyme
MLPYDPNAPLAAKLERRVKLMWMRFWMRFAGLGWFGRIATRMATLCAPPHKASTVLAQMNPKGYVAPSATIYHPDVRMGANVLIGDRVVIYQAKGGGAVRLGERVRILRDTVIETGCGGSLSIGDETWIHPRCQLNAYEASIDIGRDVQIAPNCAFYSYDHSFAPEERIKVQPLKTKGGIVVGDHAWIGVGVIVLSGVRIGRGAVIGAGSVVTHDVPDEAVAVGVPARVVKMRSELSPSGEVAAEQI